MPQTITKTGIEFDEWRTFRVLQPDMSFQYFKALGWTVLTDENMSFPRTHIRGPLTGQELTRAVNEFAAVEVTIKQREGIP